MPGAPSQDNRKDIRLEKLKGAAGEGVWMGSFSDIMFRRLTFLTALAYAIAKGRQMKGDK